MKYQDIDTLAVHAGREDFRAMGVHAAPLDLSTTYPIPELAEGTANIDAMLRGERPESNNIYARLANPTVDRFERAFAQLEQADDAVSFGSGMAAVTAALLAATMTGKRHIVAVRPLYGGTDHLLASGLLHLDVSWATASTVRDHVRADTALVVIETPANPTIELLDIADIAQQAGRVPVLVDSTFATPVLQQPLAHGAVMSLHSATKFIGGHGDVMAGVIACTEEWAKQLRVVRILTGAVLHPLAAYLLHRGLQTLPVRVRAMQAGAVTLADLLAAHPSISRVFFPSLPGNDPRHLIGRQMRGPGTMIAFEMAGGFDAAAEVMRAVKVITPAVSLGSADSLIQHPAGLTHRVVNAEGQAEGGVTPGMLRLSVGLEDPSALWTDLSAALEAAELLLQVGSAR
ncbi:MAG: aminotransferase class I/II-fold pyridoxal phosphate-dependent enzyme [Gemmatimonadetes bacterium]|nr:aminotransferase class I/II-fold pyridoxal phosphate-dependent enzyme [Gemmatimonadota bacterium]